MGLTGDIPKEQLKQLSLYRCDLEYIVAKLVQIPFSLGVNPCIYANESRPYCSIMEDTVFEIEWVPLVFLQPGGVPQSYSESLFLELAPVRQNNSRSVSISFPPHVVEGSHWGYVALVGTYHCSSFPSLLFWMWPVFIKLVTPARNVFLYPFMFGKCVRVYADIKVAFVNTKVEYV